MDSELARQYFTTSYAVQGAVLLLFGFLLHSLVRGPHARALRWWSFSWLALAAFHLSLAVSLSRIVSDPTLALSMSLVVQVSGWVHLAFFAGGSLQFFGRAISPRFLSLVAVAGGLVGAALVLLTTDSPTWIVYFVRVAPRAAVASAVFLGTVLAMSRSGALQRGAAARTFLVFASLYGLEQLHYVWTGAAVWGGGEVVHYLVLLNPIDLLLQVGMGLGMVMMVADRLRRQSQLSAEAVMQAEEELRQAHRIEAVATLAGGIAHDYNNILTAIVGYADLVDDELPRGSAGRQDLASIREAVRRASVLTQELLAFCRKQALKPERLDVRESLQAMRRSIDRSLGDDVELQMDLEQDSGQILVDPAHLELLMANLAINAREAMPEGGVLKVRSFQESVRDGSVAPGFRMDPGPAVVIEVSDNGRGMDEATRSRIFEPYFTTKGEPRAPEDGLVPGMGLSACYGFVRQSGGDVVVRSGADEGTTFRVYLPSAAREAAAVVPPRTRGNETILLVEDEKPVRETVVRTLGLRGYTVLVAENGVEALMVAEGYHDPIDLLLTDVVMPRMSGQALSRALQGVKQGVRTLFMSGYTRDELRERGIWVPDRLITKPFTGDVLAARVRGVLDGAPEEDAGPAVA